MCVAEQLVINLQHCNVGVYNDRYQLHNTLVVADVKHQPDGCFRVIPVNAYIEILANLLPIAQSRTGP